MVKDPKISWRNFYARTGTHHREKFNEIPPQTSVVKEVIGSYYYNWLLYGYYNR